MIRLSHHGSKSFCHLSEMEIYLEWFSFENSCFEHEKSELICEKRGRTHSGKNRKRYDGSCNENHTKYNHHCPINHITTYFTLCFLKINYKVDSSETEDR